MHFNHALITCNSWFDIQFPQVELIRGEQAMQINCPECHSKAIIYSTKRVHTKMSTLYCGCKNEDCAHSFVMDLSFSHSLSQSRMEKQNAALEFLRALPEAERQQLLSLS
jgi:hypothetical protein